MALEVGSAVLRTAVPSLAKLIKYERGLDKSVKHGLTRLEGELRSMHAFLENVSGMQPEQLDRRVKLWAGEVRELSYVIEKRLHSFMVRIESTKGTLLSAASKLKISHEIASYIKETRLKVQEVRKRHGPYPWKSSLESTSTREVDPRLFAMYTRESNPVGVTGAIDELTKKLSKGDHVSIVGMGGMGKTTLARAVYDKMKGGFDCSAFVPIGQRADMKKVLTYIFYELGLDIHGHEPNEGQLINQLQDFLVGKRCLIVIDDIWDMETCALIDYAFDGCAKCRIITTTRKLEVAEVIGGVYMIKPLSDANSKELLHAKIFGAEAKSRDSEFARLSDKILSKCGGVPIFIIMIGSLFAEKPREEWSKVYGSIGFGQYEDGAMQDIRMILSSSYYDLPYHLKRCFLYLSLFPEDHWIEKNMLIWKWVAEGLVSGPNDQRLGLFELGETYFDELIDRSMIQHAVSPPDLGQGGCRVHSMMFELIRDLSSSENDNFSTLLGRKRESKYPTSTIHRLAIHKTSVAQDTSMEVGEVLSFFASTCPGSSLPKLSKFGRLRVIDLEGCDLSVGNSELKDLGELVELEYVGLLGTPVAELPKKITRLKFLQTLDVRATGIRELPPFVEQLRKLKCLRAGKGTRMMGRVGELTSLEELWLHSADKSPDFAAELKKLTELRVLIIHIDKIDEGLNEALLNSLCLLKKVQVLQVWSDAEEKVQIGSWEGNTPLPELRQLLLFGIILPWLTPWIHPSRVPNLSKLLLQVEVLTVQNLEMLGQMPSLHSLYLHSDENRLSYTAGRHEFKVLEYLSTNIELVCGDGALPVIQELEVGGIKVGTNVGLQGNMPLLKRSSYHLDCIGCDLLKIEKAEAALQQASQAHPNRPTLSIKRFNNYNIESDVVESLVPEIVTRLLALKFPDTGGSLGLGGGAEAQANASSTAIINIILEIAARLLPTVGAPPTLTVSDATDGTGFPSQFAGGLPPRRPNGEEQVLLTTSSTYHVSTKDILAVLNSQYAANIMSVIGTQAGMDPTLLLNILQKWARNPEYIACLNSMKFNAEMSISATEISTLGQLMMPDMISLAEQLVGQPGKGIPQVAGLGRFL